MDTKQRSVSYGELAELEEAFKDLTKGVTFRDPEAEAEALGEYTRGYMDIPEVEGEDSTATLRAYILNTLPYFAPGIVTAGDKIPQYKQAYRLAGRAVELLKEAEVLAALSLRKSEAYLNSRIEPIRNAKKVANRIRKTAFGRLKGEGIALYEN